MHPGAARGGGARRAGPAAPHPHRADVRRPPAGTCLRAGTGAAARASPRPRPAVRAGLARAAAHRSAFMQPWGQPPQSVATGILDDETYDWRAVVEGMLLTGGQPLVVSEELAGRGQPPGRGRDRDPGRPHRLVGPGRAARDAALRRGRRRTTASPCCSPAAVAVAVTARRPHPAASGAQELHAIRPLAGKR